MSAGIRSQRIATTRVALPRAALAGLMALALLIGGLLGVAAKSQFDAAGTSTAAQSVAALPSRLLMQRAQVGVGRGPLVSDPGTGGSRAQSASHATDHIGLSELLFPISTAHHLEHGPLR